MITVDVVVTGDFQTNSYIVHDDGSTSALIIDAPGPAADILACLSNKSLKPEIMVITHAHIDHLSGMSSIRSAYPEMRTAASREAAEIFARPSWNLSVLLGGPVKFPEPEIILADGDEVVLEKMAFEARLVPGHAPGSVCLVRKDDPPIIFTGDTLFAGSVGRSDLPGGDMNELIRNIESSIMCLPEETIVYPGHGPETSIESERRNPFLAQ